jgi:hypothetical protein
MDHMRKRFTAVLLSGGAALALGLSTTAAMASNVDATWSVSPGGATKAAGSGQVKDTKTGTVAKCTSIKMSATLKHGKGLSGAGIGTIKSGTFSGCTIATVSVKVASHNLPWKLNAVSYKGGVTTGTITGIDLKATAPGCTATLDGTKAGAGDGKIKVTYNNSTGTLKLLGSGGNLHSWGVSGCFGLVKNGDPQKASGSLKVSPKQKITSP